jgi:hypothetical protein
VGLQLDFGRRQALAAREVILELMVRTGDDAVFDLAIVNRKPEMGARVLETGK